MASSVSIEIIEKNIDNDIIHKYLNDDQIKSIIEKYKNIKPEDVPKILVDCMIEAEKIQNISGEEKKKFAENLFNNIFVALVKSGINILTAYVPILTILSPVFIDIVVSATKGLIDINKVKKCCSGCFTKYFSKCFSKLFSILKCCKRIHTPISETPATTPATTPDPIPSTTPVTTSEPTPTSTPTPVSTSIPTTAI